MRNYILPIIVNSKQQLLRISVAEFCQFRSFVVSCKVAE